LNQYPTVVASSIDVTINNHHNNNIDNENNNVQNQIKNDKNTKEKSIPSVVKKPTQLSPLPSIENNNNKKIGEIWCGSEFVVAADETDGSLWSCGWNEHGNLGVGFLSINDNIANNDNNNDENSAVTAKCEDDNDVSAITKNNRNNDHNNNNININNDNNGWKKVVNKDGEQIKIKDLYEGFLACGGSHVICIAEN
jgi:alpha-tubulin suppressor-like RCC1 family protein